MSDQADLQIFPDREIGENIAALRHVANALTGAGIGPSPANDTPSSSMLPLSGRRRPTMLFSVVVLPTPLRPIRQTT